MCLALPGKVTAKKNRGHAIVSFNGLEKEVSIELVPAVKIGDWVTVHAGFAIGKLDEQEARDTIKLFDEKISS